MKIEINEKTGEFTITGKLSPKPSKSGKTTLIVSEQADGLVSFDGKEVRGSINLYVPVK
jgi:hypothetical protein